MEKILKIIESLKILEPQQIGRSEYAKGYMDAVKNIEDAIKNHSDLSHVSDLSIGDKVQLSVKTEVEVTAFREDGLIEVDGGGFIKW